MLSFDSNIVDRNIRRGVFFCINGRKIIDSNIRKTMEPFDNAICANLTLFLIFKCSIECFLILNSFGVAIRQIFEFLFGDGFIS